MISVILYGRNDSYGYNLHKRAAISLNCIAHVLSAPTDEIVFVDYNTPDDYPTFPEAIFDTLTLDCRMRLRVLRLRPREHAARFGAVSLPVLEAPARNVGVRRSSPACEWVLSTNTDMIFVPRQCESLTELVNGLSDGHYHTPRLELPESLWESMDRSKPARLISEAARWGRLAHLDVLVRGSATILFDAPGDFQLMRRCDVISINGFDERMLGGWHLDSNIARRLELLHGPAFSLEQEIVGYHTDHTRKSTAKHVSGRREDNFEFFVDDVTESVLTHQARSWGFANVEVEEIRLSEMASASFLSFFEARADRSLFAPRDTEYTPESYGVVETTPEQVLPFLVDLFVNVPQDLTIGWLGPTGELFGAFIDYLDQAGLNRPVDLLTPVQEDYADALLVNCGLPQALSGDSGAELAHQTRLLFGSERRRIMAGGAPRRIVGLNAIHNNFETLFLDHLTAALTPFATRMRHGYLRPDLVNMHAEWLAAMSLADGVRRVPNGISAPAAGTMRHIAFGPYRSLLNGNYLCEVGARWDAGSAKLGNCKILRAEIVLDGRLAGAAEIVAPSGTPGESILRVPFDVPDGTLVTHAEVVLASGQTPLHIDRVTIMDRPKART